ncbi:MAG: hypothetical protein DI546_14585 [Rhizobium sp.]|nr:MAG: hypothetical protein DI546_14585 [Rhizobium sp.]
MSYTEETRQSTCPSCGKLNHVIVAYAGDYRASPQALYAEQRFSGHNVNIGVRQRREGTGRGFRG